MAALKDNVIIITLCLHDVVYLKLIHKFSTKRYSNSIVESGKARFQNIQKNTHCENAVNKPNTSWFVGRLEYV